MSERFAIFYAPDVQSELWQLACEWLGRDAFKNQSCNRQALSKALEQDLNTFTSSPSRYGFHATLKPPMRLAEGHSEETILEYAERFAEKTFAVSIGRLRTKNIEGFLALVPEAQSEALGNLAAEVVQYFEPLRAELNQQERSKRTAAPLTPRQNELLDAYGYPYIFDEFRMHLTLTNLLDAEMFSQLEQTAQSHFTSALASNYWLDRICVYREQKAGQPFARIADFPLNSIPNEKN